MEMYIDAILFELSPDKKVNVINSDQKVLREIASKPESFFPETFFPTFREFISSRIS